MVAALLPGLRDLRSPLAAGYVWLLAMYIAFESSVPTESQATGIWESLLRLQDTISSLGAGVALSFAAYLLGSISEVLTSAVVASGRLLFTGRPARALWGRFASVGGADPPPGSGQVSASALGALNELATRRLRAVEDALPDGITLASAMREAQLSGDATRHLPRVARLIARALPQFVGARLSPDLRVDERLESDEAQRVDVVRNAMASHIAGQVVDELDLIRTNLRGRESELFSEVDRLRSEAELRVALALPMAALSGALATRSAAVPALAVLAGSAVLAVQGRGRRRESDDALIEAIRLDRAPTPSLERLEVLAKELAAG